MTSLRLRAALCWFWGTRSNVPSLATRACGCPGHNYLQRDSRIGMEASFDTAID